MLKPFPDYSSKMEENLERIANSSWKMEENLKSITTNISRFNESEEVSGWLDTDGNSLDGYVVLKSYEDSIWRTTPDPGIT